MKNNSKHIEKPNKKTMSPIAVSPVAGDNKPDTSNITSKHGPPKSSASSSAIDKKTLLFPCYVCQKNFPINLIFEHEAECLEAWKLENDNLPVDKQNSQQPEKPSTYARMSGFDQVDYIGTLHKQWQEHLDLVTCEKCQKKFFPKGLEHHDSVCGGGSKQVMSREQEKHHEVRCRPKSAL